MSRRAEVIAHYERKMQELANSEALRNAPRPDPQPPMPEAEFRRWAAGFAERLGPELVAELHEIHGRYGWNCTGASEGLWCCVDFIVVNATEGNGDVASG